MKKNKQKTIKKAHLNAQELITIKSSTEKINALISGVEYDLQCLFEKGISWMEYVKELNSIINNFREAEKLILTIMKPSRATKDELNIDEE